ncbi:apses-domain-containing protein, partial [Neoconidiobolus thromboides FSU 785]
MWNQTKQNNSPISSDDNTRLLHSSSVLPKLSAVQWEDEDTYCYQVEANNMTVARRKDNAMINGTKLLNVVGMTRGKRDGILKAEKGRHVIKSGSMVLKGVWIPLERAQEMAKIFKIDELLYPLFETDIEKF